MFRNILFGKIINPKLLRNLFSDDLSVVRDKLFKASSRKFNSKPKIAALTVNKFPLIMYGGILTSLGLKEKTPEEKEEDLIMAIKYGILHFQRNQFKEAESKLHEALKMAQDENNTNGVTYIYDILANLAFERKQYEKAEKLFVSVMQRLIGHGLSMDDNKIVHMSLKLAKIYEAQKDFEKAEQGYKFCMQTMQKKIENIDEEDTVLLWANTLDWYGRYLIENKKEFNEGLKYLKKAYEICVDINGKKHEQSIVMLNDLGTYSNMIGDGESALTYLQEAAKIGGDFPDMADLASIYINLGQLYLKKEMFKESEIACQEGLRKAKENEDVENITEANHCLNELYKFYEPQKKPA